MKHIHKRKLYATHHLKMFVVPGSTKTEAKKKTAHSLNNSAQKKKEQTEWEKYEWEKGVRKW